MERITHALEQGTDSWHTFRAQHFGASDASAMLGLSNKNSRDSLLLEKYTGLPKEHSQYVQDVVFENGHRVEALARPIVEKMIGVELYPVTMSYGKLSASCDGRDSRKTIAWENKQFNKAHFEQVKNGELPEIHWPQSQQVLHVTGAEKLFFTISDGTEENTVGVWVYPDEAKINTLLSGWAQFEKDLETYVPPVQVEKVVAETVETLPVPSVVAKGSLVASNLDDITPVLDTYLANINTTLATDQDFANAEADAKNCRESAKKLDAVSEAIIAQMGDVNQAINILGEYSQKLNKMGLLLEKAVKEQKEKVKENAIFKAKEAFTSYVQELEKPLPFGLQMPMQTMGMYPNFAEAIKGVKTIESMQSRINDALANAKVQATTLANDVKTKLALIEELGKGYDHLIVKHDLAFKDIEFIKLSIQSTIDKENARRAEREAEIKAQAEREALAKVNEDKPQLSPMAERLVSENQSSLTLPPQLEAEFGKVFSPTRTQPSANQIVEAVAKSFGVDKATAHKWLLETDFAMLMAA